MLNKLKEQMNGLAEEFKALKAAENFEAANAKFDEIKELENKMEAAKLAQANESALENKTQILDVENHSIEPQGGKVMESTIENKRVDKNELYALAWAKSMQGANLDEKERVLFDEINREFNNAYTHDTSNTSILIPETVASGIWARATEMYPLLADVKKFNVKGTFTIKKHTGITGGDAAFYDEATATADEKNAFGELSLTGCELAKSITVTWKLRTMATEEFIPFITNELGERVGVALGTAIAVGKGKPGESDTFKAEPQGIETALLAEAQTPQVVSYDPEATTADPLAYEDFTAAIAKIHSSYLAGAAIYANSSTIWNQLANLVDTTGRPLFIPDATSGGIGRMFGMVVKADAGVTTDSIVIGNPDAGYVLNTNEPMSIATEEHVKARTVDYAAYTIVDGAVLDTKAFALIRNTPAA